MKQQATDLASLSLSKLMSGFDVKEARAKVDDACSKSNPSDKISSHPALHCEEILAAACTAATATSGDDLVHLQTSGLSMLHLTLLKFRGVPDPDSLSGESILSTLTSQITSALKPALQNGGRDGYNVPWLERAAECLAFVSPELEVRTIKRLMKPLLAAGGDVALRAVAGIVVEKGDWSNSIIGDALGPELTGGLESLVLRTVRDGGGGEDKLACLLCVAGGSVGPAVAVAIEGLKSDPTSLTHLQTLTVAVEARKEDLEEFLSSNPGMSDELIGLCSRVLRGPSPSPPALSTVAKVASVLPPGPDSDKIKSVLSDACLASSAWSVWSTLSESSRIRSLPSIKPGVAEGKVDLKALSSCVPAEALMYALGPAVLSLLSSAGVAYGDKERAAKCTVCVRTLLLGHRCVAGNAEQLLSTLLPVMVPLIRKNGLPNGHLGPTPPSAGPEGPTIGRLLASCLVHFAKASGPAFKFAMAELGETDRGTLEAAVRGEMSGYGASRVGGGAGKAPARLNKISAKAF